jgi:hypothetical protein
MVVPTVMIHESELPQAFIIPACVIYAEVLSIIHSFLITANFIRDIDTAARLIIDDQTAMHDLNDITSEYVTVSKLVIPNECLSAGGVFHSTYTNGCIPRIIVDDSFDPNDLKLSLLLDAINVIANDRTVTLEDIAESIATDNILLARFNREVEVVLENTASTVNSEYHIVILKEVIDAYQSYNFVVTNDHGYLNDASSLPAYMNSSPLSMMVRRVSDAVVHLHMRHIG